MDSDVEYTGYHTTCANCQREVDCDVDGNYVCPHCGQKEPAMLYPAIERIEQ